MGSKALFVLLGLLAIVLLISSEVSARDLANTVSTSESQGKEGETNVGDAKYPGDGYGGGGRGGDGGYGGYPGGGRGGDGGYGGYPGGGRGGYGDHGGRGGYGGYPGGGHGGYGGGCRYGCCYRGYNGCGRCCGYAGEKVEVESKPHN